MYTHIYRNSKEVRSSVHVECAANPFLGDHFLRPYCTACTPISDMLVNGIHHIMTQTRDSNYLLSLQLQAEDRYGIALYMQI